MAYLRTKHLEKLPRETLHVKNKPRTTGHRQVITDFMKEIDFEPRQTDTIEPVQNWKQNFKVDESLYELGEPSDIGDITVYTDGSKNEDENLGAGFVYYSKKTDESIAKSYHLGKDITVYQSEVFAINEVAQHLLDKETRNCSIIIHSDSRAALDTLHKKFINSAQVRDTIETLNRLAAQDNTVTLRWVKAHVGHPGNEKADELAKQGADLEKDPIRAENVPLVPSSFIRNSVREKVVSLWNKVWQADPQCRQTKLFIPEISKKKALDYTKCRRTVFSAAVQFITGHNFMRKHDSIVQNGFLHYDSSLCQHCQKAPESTMHVLSECDKYGVTRYLLWGVEKLTPPYDIKLKSILEFLLVTQIKAFTDILTYTIQKE